MGEKLIMKQGYVIFIVLAILCTTYTVSQAVSVTMIGRSVPLGLPPQLIEEDKRRERLQDRLEKEKQEAPVNQVKEIHELRTEIRKLRHEIYELRKVLEMMIKDNSNTKKEI